MANRILTWSFNRFPEGGVLLPAYYMETGYEPVAVRLHAVSVPKVNEAKFDIMVDGVSIFSDKTEVKNSHDIDYQMHHIPNTTVDLSATETSDLMAEDFIPDVLLNEGSWVTCKVVNDSGARNVTIQLELETMSEPDEESE